MVSCHAQDAHCTSLLSASSTGPPASTSGLLAATPTVQEVGTFGGAFVRGSLGHLNYQRALRPLSRPLGETVHGVNMTQSSEGGDHFVWQGKQIPLLHL